MRKPALVCVFVVDWRPSFSPGSRGNYILTLLMTCGPDLVANQTTPHTPVPVPVPPVPQCSGKLIYSENLPAIEGKITTEAGFQTDF